MMVFCPDAVEWGNVADWVSGLGSILVGGAALAFAYAEKRRADRAENEVARTRAQQHNGMIAQAMQIIDRLRSANANFISQAGVPIDVGANYSIVTFEIAQASKSVALMQQHPSTDARLFGELERLDSILRLPDDFGKGSDVKAGVYLRSLNKSLDASKKRLGELRDPSVSWDW